MKRWLLLCLSLVFVICGSLPAFADSGVGFEGDDFESYAVGTILSSSNSNWHKVITNKTTEAYGVIVKEADGNQAVRFSANASAGPRMELTLNVTDLKNLTLSFRVKSEGGAQASLVLYADGAKKATLMASTAAEWQTGSVRFDFEAGTYAVTRGKSTGNAEALGTISDKSTFNLRFMQTVNASTATYWDDVEIQTNTATVETPEGKRSKAPMIAGKNGETVAILKMDDLGGGKYDAFKALADYLIENGMHGCFGAIGKNCEDFTDEQFAEIKRWTENGIEIWCHGWQHSRTGSSESYITDYQNKTRAEMHENLQKVIDLFAEHEIPIRCIGAPYNLNDDTFLTMLNEEYPSQIPVLMYGRDPNSLFEGYNLSNRVNIEASVGTASYDTFAASYEKNMDKPYIVMQGHAGQWGMMTDETASSCNEFKKIAAKLQEDGVVTMTPMEYVAYIEQEYYGDTPYSAKIQFLDETGAVLNAMPNQTGTMTCRFMIRNASEREKEALVLAAFYCDGILSDCKMETKKIPPGINTVELSIENSGNADRVTAYLWEDIGSLKAMSGISKKSL